MNEHIAAQAESELAAEQLGALRGVALKKAAEAKKEEPMSYTNMSHKNYTISGSHPYNDALVLLTDASSKSSRGGVSQEPDPRATILLEAARCILTDRNSLYGDPEDNFANIAPYNTAWLRPKLKDGEVVDEVDVALLTAGVKLGRLHTDKYVRDTWVDLVGYIACAFRCSELSRQAEEKAPRCTKEHPEKVKVALNLWEVKTPQYPY
jgi:hypothetical protein